MGYYTRVLSTSSDCVPLSVLTAALKKEQAGASIHADSDADPDEWEQIALVHPDGREIESIERNVVDDGSVGEGELDEFIEELSTAKPTSSAEWLAEFLPMVKTIYAIQHLSGTEVGDGFAALSAVRSAIWRSARSILQADGEGFSDEDGYQITWDFSDRVEGDWWMGLLKDGKWIHFQMDLGNREQRSAFCAGEVPRGVKLAE